MGYVTVDTSWCWVQFHLLLFQFLGLCFENRVVLWVSFTHPKTILNELFSPQLWVPTSFHSPSFQHEKVLFHLPLHFVQSFAYCVPLNASLTDASGRIHGIEARFLVKEVYFLLTNGGLRWIQGIGTRFLVKQVHIY